MNIGAIGRQVDDDRESTLYDDRGRVGLTREPPDRQSSFMTCRQHSRGGRGAEEDGGHFALVIVGIITRTSSLEMMMTRQTKNDVFCFCCVWGMCQKIKTDVRVVVFVYMCVCVCLCVCMYVCVCEPS